MGQDQDQWLQLVQSASANVKQARTLDADWPEGTLEQADEALDAALASEPPPPPPPPPEPVKSLVGFAISYGGGHDPARDFYPAPAGDLDRKEWGPHHGIEILAPGPGRVESYQFPTPINRPESPTPEQEEYWNRSKDLFNGYVCAIPQRQTAQGIFITAQLMFVCVYWPDDPAVLGGLKASGYGHVRGDISVGRVNTGDRMCTVWDSGIRFENAGIVARASHCHLTGYRTTRLSPNGDVDGLYVAIAHGWNVEWRGEGGPGPEQYFTGQWIAGKLARQWGGHPIPPMPS
jgi:hypothetical protein